VSAAEGALTAQLFDDLDAAPRDGTVLFTICEECWTLVGRHRGMRQPATRYVAYRYPQLVFWDSQVKGVRKTDTGDFESIEGAWARFMGDAPGRSSSGVLSIIRWRKLTPTEKELYGAGHKHRESWS